jgi:hypothetical protein
MPFYPPFAIAVVCPVPGRADNVLRVSKTPPDDADGRSVTASERRHKPPLRSEIITAGATVLAAVVAATGTFAVGWLQYRGPGSSPEVTPTTTTTVTALPSLPIALPAGGADLKDLSPISADGDWGTRTASIGNHRYPNALTALADCNASRDYQLEHPYKRLRAIVGVADDTADPNTLEFSVVVNGNDVWDSGSVSPGKSVPVDVPLQGAVRLKLVTDGCGTYARNTGVWANARLEP